MESEVAAKAAPTIHTLPGSSNIPLADFPSPEAADTVEPAEEADRIINHLNESFQDATFNETADLFCTHGYWRDHLMISWNFRTVKGPAQIADFLQIGAKSKDGFRLKKVAIDKSTPSRQPSMGYLDGEASVPSIQAFLSVESVLGSGEGFVRLAREGGKWKIYAIYTSLRALKGYNEAIFSNRPQGVSHGGQPGRKNWADRRALARDYRDGSEPEVLIVGAGQAGLTAAVRLKALGVNALVIEKNERVGDSWRRRYHQLVLHDPVWYDHLPFLNFPPQWPVFSPKDKLADWFEAYANIMELNVWLKTELVSSSWDDETRLWSVDVVRKLADGTSELKTFHPHHIIQATGHSGEKNQPDIKGLNEFAGRRICHSSEFTGARQGGDGLKAVVVGSCNSGHDIAQDFVENGYHVTMVQRSSTHVVSSQAVTEIALKGIYSEDGPPVEDADMIVQSMSSSMLKAIQVVVAKIQRDNDRDLLQGLEKAGFKVDHGPDDSGLFFKYFQRGGGYYIDVGASRLIAEGKIKVKHGQEITEILPHGIRFSDGSELEADEIIFATGYQSMRSQTRHIFGDLVADRVGDVWGWNEEGEMRTIWQRTGHPGFWYHGGNLALCRYYSQLLALQIKGLEEEVYAYEED
ncbi:uncharacterized protein UV8b_06046 [Ustilaginoidea virens]|uniref:Uncharacterized protein n=1 Tax=Ustilaginoidea virens TaxID=1159556 RepID=A0A063BW63_USTVR|nr:uncharacterized protein UV8b_06046 [Ustilaginoidea virens]QUC21805.1 hypothetical protein UV8b_06046 [Ustilaginoidea virens]GAO17626.1 hypothetical protein UVI_02051090 [Ustilaginoidea virens]